MAVTVTDDLTTIDLCDSAAAWNTVSPMSQESVDPDSNVEGTNCIQARIASGGGVALINANHGSTDFTDKHLFAWMRQSMIWATYASGGVRFRIATSTDGTTAYGQWNTLGQDKGVASFKGWVSGVIDILKPFQSINGTPPAITAVISTGMQINWLTGNGKSLAIVDYVKIGSKIFVKGGGVATEGTFPEISVADETAGRGLLKEVGGVSFVNSGIDFGDTGTLTTRFIDGLRSVVFEDWEVAGGFYKITHLGNATGTNLVTFGEVTGTGVDEEGSAGINFSSAGDAPFWIEAIDANVDNAEYFGCNLTGPPAIYDDQVRNFKQEDNSGGPSFIDDTRDANDPGTNDTAAFPSGAGANDACYFGHNEKFYSVTIAIAVAAGEGSGTYTVTWEYYNGTAWAALTDVTDGTNAFKTGGTNVVDYAIPDDWAKVTVDTDNRYWIRARRDGGTVTTNPNLTQVTVQMAGDVRWEDPADKMIGCVLTNMGSVRVRSGAFLKKTTISGSLCPAKHAAVDLGSADPTANTVRDLNITNCNKGLLLKGTSTGTTTYNLRNIQFSGNTKDVRVDFPAGATVVLNILEGGKALVAGDVDNVNASTLTINANVSVTYNGLINGSEVRVYLAGTSTVVDGVESVTGNSFTWSVGASVSMDIKIFGPTPTPPSPPAVAYNNIIQKGVSFATDTTIGINQTINRNYRDDV